MKINEKHLTKVKNEYFVTIITDTVAHYNTNEINRVIIIIIEYFFIMNSGL